MASIFKREWRGPDGRRRVRWDAQVYLGRNPATGRGERERRSFPTRAEAEAWATDKEAARNRGEIVAGGRMTLADWLRSWLDDHAAHVRDVTIHGYRAVLRRWILDPPPGTPLIGSRRLDRLTPQDVNRLYRHMIALGVRPAGVRALHRVLRPALRAAVREGRLARSPVDLARVPRPDAKAEDPDAAADAAEGRALTREEADRLVAAARGDRLEALWLVLLTGGLRPCEAFALRWDDLDWQAGAVRVRATLTRAGLDRERHPEGWKLTRPKTARSRRTVTLPAVTMAALRAHRTAQRRERLRAGPLWREHGFVFTTEIGTPLDGGNVASRDWVRVAERAGLGSFIGPEPRKPRRGPAPRRRFKPSHRVYDLRHTHATLLLMDGEDLLVVSRRLGHSGIKLTADTYASVTRERAEGAAERLDRMFGAGA